MQLQRLKDVGNDLAAKVLLLVTLLCMVSNNLYTNIALVCNMPNL